MGPRASRSSKLRGFADGLDGSGGVDVLTVFSRGDRVRERRWHYSFPRPSPAKEPLGSAARAASRRGSSRFWSRRLDPPERPVGATVLAMTAKEKLRQAVEELSEAEAQDALGFIVRRRDARDDLGALLDGAPLDDEPTTLEEDEGVAEAHGQIARGEVVSADEIRREVA
jgi:hypothetical protein